MDNKIIEYRTKHKKCKWCKYYKYNLWVHHTDCSYGECILKGKIINFENQLRLCKYYELKKENK